MYKKTAFYRPETKWPWTLRCQEYNKHGMLSIYDRFMLLNIYSPLICQATHNNGVLPDALWPTECKNQNKICTKIQSTWPCCKWMRNEKQNRNNIDTFMQGCRWLDTETNLPVIGAAIVRIGPIAEVIAIAHTAEQREAAGVDPSITATHSCSTAIVAFRKIVGPGERSGRNHQ